MRFSTGLARGAWLVVVLVAISCAEPPHKEMDQAQGAIDAARAAGAEQYAAAEFTAATKALAQSNEAVTARDYRLALNYALDRNEADLPSGDAALVVLRGYAYARADVRGTYNSGGCWNYGGIEERHEG